MLPRPRNSPDLDCSFTSSSTHTQRLLSVHLFALIKSEYSSYVVHNLRESLSIEILGRSVCDRANEHLLFREGRIRI